MERYANFTRDQIAVPKKSRGRKAPTTLKLSPDLQKRLMATMAAAKEKGWNFPNYWKKIGEVLWGFHVRREHPDTLPKAIELLAKKLWLKAVISERKR